MHGYSIKNGIGKTEKGGEKKRGRERGRETGQISHTINKFIQCALKTSRWG